MESRRRTQRFTLLQPLPARAGNERALIVDVSLSGVRLSHLSLLPEGKPCAISLEWQGSYIAFTAEPRWTREVTGAYLSGFEIKAIDRSSSSALQRLIDSSGEAIYARHEFTHGVWRKTLTTDPSQPVSGFTVSVDESPNTVDFFRAAYSLGDINMRERIRRLATLSIEHPERHYDT